MSEQLSRRLTALEQATNSTPALLVVFAAAGESAKEALLREGVNTDAGQLVLVVVFG